MDRSWRPEKEVEIIVGTPPGGGQDRPARALMRILEAARLVDVPMRLTNITGKGGGNAWDAVRRRPSDPHVLSISSAPLITNALLGECDFDHRALTPIATLYTECVAFVVRADASLQSGADLLGRLKSDPGSLTFAIATALGTTNHIALGQIVQHLGGDPKALELRVFDSALYAVQDVIDRNADAAAVSAVSAVKGLESGELRALAVSAFHRMGGVFAQAPTWVEQSVPCTIGLWRGIVAAPAITEAQGRYWVQAFAAATSRPEWLEALEKNYWVPLYLDGEKTRAFLDEERVFLGRMMRELGLIG